MAVTPYATSHPALKAKLEIFDPAPILWLRFGMQELPTVVIVGLRKLDIEEGQDLVDNAADAVKILGNQETSAGTVVHSAYLSQLLSHGPGSPYLTLAVNHSSMKALVSSSSIL